MNCISSQSAYLRKQSWGKQVLVLCCFCAGAAAMIGIGKFA
jgi:hypothetical protein